MIVSTLMHLLQQGALWLQNDVNLLPAIPLCGTEQHLIAHLGHALLAGSGPQYTYICAPTTRFSTSVKPVATSGSFTSCTVVNSCAA